MKRYVVEKASLEHNVRLILEKAGDKVVWGVIKGNGYGLGVVPMSRLLAAYGIRHFAVTDIHEVRALREDGCEDPILMLSGTCDPAEVNELLDLNAILTVSSVEDAKVLDEQARLRATVAEAHVKIDTGMGRYGFLPEQMDTITGLYAGYPNIAFSGIYTHFYNSSSPEPTKAQFTKFNAVVEELKAAKLEPGMVHCCNSSAFLKYPNMHCDAVRVGSGLLGRVTVGSGTGLKVIGDCQAAVEEIRTIPVGHSVGYGAGWTAKRETLIAVISIGYFNGFAVDRGFDLWRLSDCFRGVARYVKAFLQKKALYVTINGKACRVLGHVGMVNMVVDITDCDCGLGDMAHVNINPLLLKGVDVVYL